MRRSKCVIVVIYGFLIFALHCSCCGPEEAKQNLVTEEVLRGRMFLDRVAKAQAKFLVIYIYAGRYCATEGRYPNSLSDLIASKHADRLLLSETVDTHFGRTIVDEWTGKPLRYFCPGKVWTDAFDVYSFGPNGIDDEGECDDLTSWELLTREEPHGPLSYHVRHDAVQRVCKRLLRLSGENKE